MRHERPTKRLLFVAAVGTVAAAAAAVVTIRWAWNVLALQFGGAPVDLQHVLAGLVLIATLAALLRNRRHGRHDRWQRR